VTLCPPGAGRRVERAKVRYQGVGLLESSTAAAFTFCTDGRASRGQNRSPDYPSMNHFDTDRIAITCRDCHDHSAIAFAGGFELPTLGLGAQGRAREPDRERNGS